MSRQEITLEGGSHKQTQRYLLFSLGAMGFFFILSALISGIVSFSAGLGLGVLLLTVTNLVVARYTAQLVTQDGSSPEAPTSVMIWFALCVFQAMVWYPVVLMLSVQFGTFHLT
jgi:hypothetical protein